MTTPAPGDILVVQPAGHAAYQPPGSLSYRYAKANDAQVFANATDLLITGVSGNLVLAANTIALLAGHTYELVCELRGADMAIASTLEFGWVDGATNAELIANTGRGVLDNLVSVITASSLGLARIMYTPVANQTVKVRGLAGAGTPTLNVKFGHVRALDLRAA